MAIYQSILAFDAFSGCDGMFTLLNNRLRLSLAGRVTLLEQALDKHFEDYELDRERARVMNEQMLHRLDEQDAQVLRLHKANQESDAKIIEAVQQLQGSTNTFDQLLPSIKSGIEADARRQYRRKGVQRIAGAVISTLVAISALIPLAQLLLGLQISIHAG